MTANLDSLNAYFRKHQRSADVQVVGGLVQKFVGANLSARTSPNLQTKACDDWSSLVAILRTKLCANVALVEAVMKSFKILFRKEVNRRSVQDRDVKVVVAAIATHRQQAGVVREGANAVLNMCYERENVYAIVDTVCAEVLVSGLNVGNPATVQASCAGALQSISYQSIGRQHVQSLGAITHVLPLLWSEDSQVRARAAGVIHNLSSLPTCVAQIRENDGIAAVLALLKENDPKIISSAAGAVQNLAREPASRQVILDFPSSIQLLGSLLFRSDAQCQAFGVGALLNLISPNFESLPDGEKSDAKLNLRKLLSDCVAIGSVYDVVFRQT